MRKIILILIVVITFIMFLVANFSIVKKNTPSVSIKNKTFYVDIAKTDQEKGEGLSIYDKLPSANGMLFIFEKPDYYSFWMKNMKFAIDIIYIKDNKITDIYKDVPPPKSKNEFLPIIKPKEQSDTVLEINAGLCDKYNFKKGDSVIINY